MARTTTTSPTVTHTYATVGSYKVTLTVTNAQGTSTTQVFTGQTVSNNGGPAAATSQNVTIDSAGYDLAGSDGGVFVFPVGQSSGFFGSLPGLGVKVSDVVGIVPTNNFSGYDLVGSDGGVFVFPVGQSAGFFGSLPGLGVKVVRHRGDRAHRQLPGLRPGGVRRRGLRLPGRPVRRLLRLAARR